MFERRGVCDNFASNLCLYYLIFKPRNVDPENGIHRKPTPARTRVPILLVTSFATSHQWKDANVNLDTFSREPHVYQYLTARQNQVRLDFTESRLARNYYDTNSYTNPLFGT
jgi:hypothetical protein